MAALDQYIRLMRENRQALDANAFPAVNARRNRAAEALELAGRLPVRSDEGYEKTSIEEMFAPDFAVNVNRMNIPVDVAKSFRCDVPNISTLLAVVVNDRFVPTSTLLKNLPEGVTVCSLREAPAHVLDSSTTDTATLFNDLLLQDGVYIHIAKGVKVDRPIQLVDIFSCQAPMLAARRVVVEAENGAEVSILKCDHTQTSSVAFASSEVIEIRVGKSARVDWYDIEESTPQTSRWCRWNCRQEEESQLNICVATLTNGSTRNEYNIAVEGDRCQTRLSGMAVGSNTQHIDNSSYLTHTGDRSHSNQLFKYVLDDNASGAFEGCIEVAHNARFNEAYQSNRNILASKGARMHTKPQLLIYNDDVKCSHGASTGQLDEDALFYMQTRGIPREEARKMLMQAFMVEVVDNVRLTVLRDRLRHMLEMRFSGDCADSTCSSCKKKD